MRARTSLSTLTILSLALAAGLPAAAGASEGATGAAPPASHPARAVAPDELTDEQAVREQVRSAAAQAQRSTGWGATQRRSPDLPEEAELDAALAQLVADGAIGVSATVRTQDGSWSGADGVRRPGGSPPALEHSQFRAASNTKMMIATLVLQEVEAGTWTLQTPVAAIIPGLFPDHPDVTIEHLLSHTSGMPLGTYELIGPYVEDPTDWDDFVTALSRDYADAEHIAAVNAAPWLFEPGQGMNYSNSGYVALGLLLEEVTGRPVEDLVRERVLRPAGMTDTTYPDEPGLTGRSLQEAMFTDERGWVGLGGFDPDVFSHAGTAVSTADDLADLTAALMSGELVSQASVEAMTTPVLPNPINYGLGLYAIPDPCVPGSYLYGHDGASFGTLSIAFSSRDGSRQLALGVTGRDLTLTQDALYDLDDALVPMLLATC